MSVKLKELVDMAANGCISEPKEVAEIINRFVGLTLDEQLISSDFNRKCVEEVFEDLLPSVGVSNERMRELSYLDMVVLIDNLFDSDYFDGDRDYSFTFSLFMIDLLREILLSAVDCPSIQLFLSVNVTAFFDDLKSRHNNGMVAQVYENLVSNAYMYLEYEIKETTSISDLLKKIGDVKDVHWKPWNKKIMEYEKTVLQCFGILRVLLVVSFKLGFPERSNLDTIIETYKN